MPPTDSGLVEELRRLEGAGDLAAGARLLAARRLSAEALLALAIRLYQNELSALPLFIAQQLRQAGAENWITAALAAHLALRLGQQGLAEAAGKSLAALLAESPEERASARRLLDPLLPRDVVRAFAAGDTPLLRDLARLWAAVEPETMAALAPPEPGRPPDIERLLTPGPEAALRPLQGPPPGAPVPRRKVVLALRRYWIPHDPRSREHEVPPVLDVAMRDYGWEPIHYALRGYIDGAVIAEDYRAIAALCRESGADLVLLDDFLAERHGDATPGEVLRALRAERPTLRILGVYFDPWASVHWDTIERGAALLDGIWSPAMTALWQRPSLRGKVLLTPLPHGVDAIAAAPLTPVLAFLGGVQYSNWYRAPWLTAIADAGLPLRVDLSAHASDKLDPLESYRRYMARLSAAGVLINFARRSDGTKTTTGRTYEVPAAGGLLVQERSDDIDLFLVPGRHYLRFETLQDLADIVHLLRTAPERAEAVRRAGADFMRERYSDRQILGYLDRFVFHPHSAATADPASTCSSPEGS